MNSVRSQPLPSVSHVRAHGGGVPQSPAVPAPVIPLNPLAPPPAATKKPSALKKALVQAAKLLAVAVIGGGAYLGYTHYERRQPYEWSGSVEMHTMSVGSRIGGRVQTVLVREGQTVEAGEVLVVLEAGQLRAQKAIADAEVHAAEALVLKLENGARPEEVAQAMARVAAARASLGRAATLAEHEGKESKKAKSLLAQGAISFGDEEAAGARAKTASGSLAEARAQAYEGEAALKLLTRGTRAEDLSVARAQVEVSKAKLEMVNVQIEELSVRSPKAARVESITVRPGDILRADAHAVSLLEQGQIYVRIYIPEPRLGNIHVGQEVPVSVDAYGKRTFRGRVDHINEVGEFTPRRLVTTEERADEVFAARITLLEGDTELKAGMAAFIHVKK
jgi:HlyD family secretion protein